MQQMLCIAIMNLNNLVQTISTLFSNVLKQINQNYGSTVLRVHTYVTSTFRGWGEWVIGVRQKGDVIRCRWWGRR